MEYVSISSTLYFGFFFLPSLASVIRGSSPKPLHICIALQSILEMSLIVCDMSITRTDARPEPWGQAQLIPEPVLQQRKWCIQGSKPNNAVTFCNPKAKKQKTGRSKWDVTSGNVKQLRLISTFSKMILNEQKWFTDFDLIYCPLINI